MCLCVSGFVISDDTPAYLSRPATPTSMGNMGGGAKSPEDVNADRLHLILGQEPVHPPPPSLHRTRCVRWSPECLVVPQGSVCSSCVLHTRTTRWRTSLPVCELCRRCWTSPGPEPGSGPTR